MPILQSNTKDELQDIYAPSYLDNRYVGKTVGLNYFGYPSDTTQYNVTAPYSTKIQRDIDLAHKTWALSEVGMSIVAERTTWLNTILPTVWDWPPTSECDESTYISRETFIDLPASLHLNEGMALIWTEHDHDICIDHGVAESLPQARIRFAQLHGLRAQAS